MVAEIALLRRFVGVDGLDFLLLELVHGEVLLTGGGADDVCRSTDGFTRDDVFELLTWTVVAYSLDHSFVFLDIIADNLLTRLVVTNLISTCFNVRIELLSDTLNALISDSSIDGIKFLANLLEQALFE